MSRMSITERRILLGLIAEFPLLDAPGRHDPDTASQKYLAWSEVERRFNGHGAVVRKKSLHALRKWFWNYRWQEKRQGRSGEASGILEGFEGSRGYRGGFSDASRTNSDDDSLSDAPTPSASGGWTNDERRNIESNDLEDESDEERGKLSSRSSSISGGIRPMTAIPMEREGGIMRHMNSMPIKPPGMSQSPRPREDKGRPLRDGLVPRRKLVRHGAGKSVMDTQLLKLKLANAKAEAAEAAMRGKLIDLKVAELRKEGERRRERFTKELLVLEAEIMYWEEKRKSVHTIDMFSL